MNNEVQVNSQIHLYRYCQRDIRGRYRTQLSWLNCLPSIGLPGDNTNISIQLKLFVEPLSYFSSRGINPAPHIFWISTLPYWNLVYIGIAKSVQCVSLVFFPIKVTWSKFNIQIEQSYYSYPNNNFTAYSILSNVLINKSIKLVSLNVALAAPATGKVTKYC